LTAAFAAAALMLAGGTLTSWQANPAKQEPAFTIRHVEESANRPLIHINGLLDDPALEEAARSGLPLRVRVRVELWKDGWIDNLVNSETSTSVLLYEPLGQEYIVRPNPRPGTALRFPTYSAARHAIEREYLLGIQPRVPGRFYYTATLEVETLSLSDLDELERWLQGELQPAVSGDRSVPGAVGQGVKRLMIRLLSLPARRMEARSQRFTAR
jgi:hypothetical protein